MYTVDITYTLNRRVVATDDIPAGTVIMTGATPSSSNEGNVMIVEYPKLKSSNPFERIIIGILLALFNETYESYIAQLPSIEELEQHHPFYLNDEVLDVLAIISPAFKSEIERQRKEVASITRSITAYNKKRKILNPDIITERMVGWAYTLVLSRSFREQQKMRLCMCAELDMLQHSPTPNTIYRVAEDSYTVTTNKTIKKGEEITDYYIENSFDLLVRYGFWDGVAQLAFIYKDMHFNTRDFDKTMDACKLRNLSPKEVATGYFMEKFSEDVSSVPDNYMNHPMVIHLLRMRHEIAVLIASMK